MRDDLFIAENRIQFPPFCFQNLRIRKRFRGVRVEALQRDVDGAREVPGGKVGSGAEVKDAALRAEDEVGEEVLGEGLRGFVEVGEKDDGTALPAFVVAVEVDFCQVLLL